ncbi:hypothetical protein AJ78_00079 [Emergomyces pasteurianus Ep9510]|uniref:C2H2-type domain-containing protein n=1 Tax=Emergomyces pasteurianus Ep9510 TaxID=1447872 RepID=A0A1J9PUV5_9EURO|nr:hypothetical protein AJ78_00079 [Emergomyces pasteurianus Ep9510]
MFQCQVCGIRMQFQQNYLVHIQTGQALQCVSCFEIFDSLCALRSHRQLAHSREFEESQRMMQDADIAAKLWPHQSSTNNIADSVPEKKGNAVDLPGNAAIDLGFFNTDGREHSENKVETGFQQSGTQGDHLSVRALTPDPSPGQEPEIKEGGDLIDLARPDEKASDLDEAVEALIESIRKRTQQSDGSSPVNRTEYCMSGYPPSTISDQANNHEHTNAISSERIEIAQCKLSTSKKECEGDDERLSHGSTVSTRFYTPEFENSDRAKRVKYSEMKKPSENLDAVRSSKELSQSIQDLASMQQEHSGARIVCFECEATFSTIIGLQHHQIMHEHNYCKLCFSFFNERSLFERHIQLMHSFKCIGCRLTYQSWEKKTEHQRLTGHGYCKECNSYFKDRVSHAKHLSWHSWEMFTCPICKANFATEERRNMHQSATQHGYCKKCACYFHDRETFIKHVKVHTPAGPAGPICGNIFSREENRGTHQRERKHAVCARCDKEVPVQESDNSPAPKHKCTGPGCQLSFPTAALLETHKRISHHFCKPCNRVFVDKMALSDHERSAKHIKKALSDRS